MNGTGMSTQQLCSGTIHTWPGLIQGRSLEIGRAEVQPFPVLLPLPWPTWLMIWVLSSDETSVLGSLPGLC